VFVDLGKKARGLCGGVNDSHLHPQFRLLSLIFIIIIFFSFLFDQETVYQNSTHRYICTQMDLALVMMMWPGAL
jgi:hypothetical protein